jgi:MFS family permease
VKPTAVRWRILALLLGHAFFCHFNRVSISVAGNERILKEFGISETLLGAVFTAYLLAYTLCMTPGGWFIDRRGTRLALLVVGFGSAAFVLLTGVAGLALASAALLIPALIGIRALMGVVNAPIHPSAAHSVSRWMPAGQQSRANGLVTAAALVGVASTYYGFGFLMDRLGWPGAFLAAGAVTAAWSLLWLRWGADEPRRHSGVNVAERQLIERERPAVPEAPEARPLLTRSVVCLTLSYAAVGYFQYLPFYWAQHYFTDVLHTTTQTSRLYTTILTLSMAVGMLLGGWITDRAQASLGRRRGRARVAAGALLGSAVFLALGLLRPDATWIVVWYSLATASVGACEGAFWTTAGDLGGARGGTAAAVMNTGGNAGGALAPLATPALAALLGWTGSLALACVFSAAGAVLWLWIRPPEPVEEPVRPPRAAPVEGFPSRR